MKGIPGLILYHQTYYVKYGEMIAYCPHCEDAELLVDDNEDYARFGFCPDCHSTFSDPEDFLMKEATKDSENNPPEWVHDYSAHYIIRQGSGNWENVKYRTEIPGTVTEIGDLQKVLRSIPDRSAATLIQKLGSKEGDS